MAQADDDADLHHHDRDAVEQRLDAVLADRGLDAAAVDLAQVPVDVGGGRGELDRADRVERGDQGAAERAPGRPTTAAAERPATRRPSDEATAEVTITPSSTPPASSACRRPAR